MMIITFCFVFTKRKKKKEENIKTYSSATSNISKNTLTLLEIT